MTQHFQNIPEEMKQLPNWCVWKLEIEKEGEKPKKNPYSVPHNTEYKPKYCKKARSNDPSTWGTFDQAVQLSSKGFDGIGFMFTDTPFVGIDIDDGIDSVSGKAKESAADIITQAASYTELSQSKQGFHIILRGTLPVGRRQNKDEKYTTGIIYEMYGHGSPRYFAMTGNVWEGRREITENQAAIDQIHEKYIAKPKEDVPKPTREAQAVTLSDDEVLSKAMNNPKMGGAFLALYNGDWQGKYGSQSEADQAFCNYLAFWTGCNDDQMDRIFRSSGLIRPKWDEKHGLMTYGEKTITKACDDCTEVYSPDYKKQETPAGDFPAAIRADELQKKVFQPIQWVWEYMLPPGLALIAGASKTGKSWFVLQLALSVAAGADFLGKGTKENKVLYLAVEDGERRLQGRMNKLLENAKASPNLLFMIKAKALSNGLVEQLTPYVIDGVKLIIIDTLQKIRGAHSSNKNAYAADYEDMGKLKEFADKYEIAVLLVHHVRKMKDEDPYNMISGTNGIMGAADTIMLLMKEKRKDTKAYLSITGRDVMSDTFVLDKDSKTGYGWAYIGEKDAIDQMTEEQNYNNDPVVLTIRELVKDNGTWSGTATDLNTAIYNHRGESVSVQYLGRKLRELQPELLSRDNIIYEAPTGDHTKRIHTFKVEEPLCI